MPRAKSILVSLVVAVSADGWVLAFPQDGGNDPAVAPRARPNGQPASAKKPALDSKKMEWLLTAWEGQSKKLRALDVKIDRIDKTPAPWQEENLYEGRAVLKSPQLAYLEFKKVHIDPKTQKRVATPHEVIIMNETDVWQYLFEDRKIFIYPLNKEERQRALEEGPLPFLFNMKAGEAKHRYEMALQAENEKYYFVVIHPKLQEDRESFVTAWVWLDRQFLLPLRIVQFLPDNKSTRDFRLSNIKANPKVGDEWFRGGVPANKSGDPKRAWKVLRNPDAQGRGGENSVAPRRQPAGQPALRPIAPGPEQRR
jgi:TIGR03009 family protein